MRLGDPPPAVHGTVFKIKTIQISKMPVPTSPEPGNLLGREELKLLLNSLHAHAWESGVLTRGRR